MAGPILKLHKLTYNDGQASKTVYFRAHPDTYKGLKTATGVELVDDDEKPDTIAHVSEMLGTGVIVRAHVYYKAGTQRKTAQLLVPANKFLGFRKQIGKPYRNGTITQIRQKRTAYNY